MRIMLFVGVAVWWELLPLASEFLMPGASSPPLTLVVRPNTKETPGPTYQVLYSAVTVGRVAPLASVADSTANWCLSSGLCWVVLLDGHTWQRVNTLLESYLVSAGRVASLVPTNDSKTPNSPLFCSSNHFNVFCVEFVHAWCPCPGGSMSWMNFELWNSQQKNMPRW